MTLPLDLKNLVDDFCHIPEVEGVFLAGSRGSGTADPGSDFDFYIYSSLPIPVASRSRVFKAFGADMEMKNTYWEEEDDGWLGALPIEFIYRSWDWIDEQLDRTLVRQEAWVGYTTCFWANVRHSEVIFDRTGRAEQVYQKAQSPYPVDLRQRIIEKNLPLLTRAFPNYFDQVKKALERQDWVSVQHRCAAFLASWFDVVWAVNRQPHPGEKKLLSLTKQLCPLLPPDWESGILKVCGPSADMSVLLKALTELERGLVDIVNEGS